MKIGNPSKPGSAVKIIFRTLRYRNFRLFFAGQSISLIGTWMQQIAMGWLVYRLTNSIFLLGVVSFSSQVPSFILSPFTGVLADRWNRRKVLIVTQFLSMAEATVLAVLTLSGAVMFWHVVVLGVFLGCINALDIPARHAFVVEMVERKEDLSNAIALNSLMFNGARMIGPSIAGLIVAFAGEGVCFLINAVSFVAVIASLYAMKIRKIENKNNEKRVFDGLKEGFHYAFGFVPIRMILALLGVTSLLGASYMVLMPVFAKDLLKGGPGTFGFMMAFSGAGALVATLYLAFRKSVLGLGKMIPVFSSIFSLGLIAFSLSRSLWLSLVLLALTGFGFMASTASSNTILQTIVDDDKRGRVMSLYTMSFMGMAPIGSLLVGFFASRIGPTNTLIAGSIFCIIASLVFTTQLPLLRKTIHPIYRRIGIIKEVASGMGAVTDLAVPPED